MTRRTLHAFPIALALLAFAAAPGARAGAPHQDASATKTQSKQKPQSKETTEPHQHPAGEAQAKGQAQAGMMAKCQEMMKQHEQMMADQKMADQRLDDLVAKMNSASGQAKTDATAAVVTEMVSQRKAMHESMMKMHHGAMMHMSEHMQAGPKSMAMCPMMKMGGAKH